MRFRPLAAPRSTANAVIAYNRTDYRRDWMQQGGLSDRARVPLAGVRANNRARIKPAAIERIVQR